MEVVLLRKLAGKSQMKFGKYADATVNYLIEHDKRLYLKWVYCNADGITFTDDILDELHIEKEIRIPKPGTAPKLFDLFLHRLSSYQNKIKPFGAIKCKSHQKRKMRAYVKDRESLYYATKGALQHKNHGH